MATTRKRVRDEGGPKTYKWRACQTRTVYPVQISTADEDEECVISCMPVREARLEWLELTLDMFVPSDETLCKATLPCGHSFAAMPL
eukprot:1820931-Rhodomonas_salina.1